MPQSVTVGGVKLRVDVASPLCPERVRKPRECYKTSRSDALAGLMSDHHHHRHLHLLIPFNMTFSGRAYRLPVSATLFLFLAFFCLATQATPVKRLLNLANSQAEQRYGISIALSECLDHAQVDFVDAQRNDSHTYFEASQGDNIRFHWHPLAIAFPQNTQQVSHTITCAKQHGNIQTVARSGGHSFSGFSSGGQDRALIVDFRNMESIVPDSANELVHIEPGARLGDVAKALWADGKRAMPHGTCPTVGVGGHALCGGVGPMSRKWGMAMDNMVEAEVVLADGSIVRASQHENPDLWWALRGAGAYYGLTTRFTFTTYDASFPVTQLKYKWSTSLKAAQDPVNLMQAIQAFGMHPELPREIGFHVQIQSGLQAGKLTVTLRGLYMGDTATYQEQVAPKLYAELTRYGVPIPDSKTELQVSYLEWLELWDDFGGKGEKLNTQIERKIHNNFVTRTSLSMEQKPFSKQGFETIFRPLWQRLEDEDQGVLPSHLYLSGTGDNTFWSFTQFFELFGGVNNRMRDPDLVKSSAMAHRDALWLMQSSVGTTADRPLIHSAYDFLHSLDAWIQKAMQDDKIEKMGYSCYLDSTLDDWAHLYYGKSLKRMVEIKEKLDASNLFRSPQSLIETPRSVVSHPSWLNSPHPLPR